jgi:hypothetical protein
VKNTVLLTASIWFLWAGPASAQPDLQVFAGITTGVLVGDSADNALHPSGMELRLSTAIMRGTRLEAMTTLGGPDGNRLSGVQLLRERGATDRATIYTSFGLLRAHEPRSPLVKSFPVVAGGAGGRVAINSRVGIQHDLQWLFPLVGFRASIGASVRMGH